MRQFVSLLSGLLIATVLTAIPVHAAPTDSPRDSVREQTQHVKKSKAAHTKRESAAKATSQIWSNPLAGSMRRPFWMSIFII